MKKILGVLLGILFMIPLVAKAEEKVKVYVFEAGGCPYCELQIEYLEGLESYNVKFEIVKKELYVDHVDWAQGKDYELGKSVATVFQNAGFEDASYSGTPFVVISDLYAAAAYSTDLESIIDAAYAEGDKDAVSCIAAGGGTSCIRARVPEEDDSEGNGGIVVAIVAGIVLVAIAIYVARTTNEEDVVVEEEVKEEKKPARKTTTKKATTTKKTTTTKKKTTTKKTNKK